jgi:hypothetical protein
VSKADRDQGSQPRLPTGERAFRCGHCQAMVEPPPWGGKHRNHCPACLYSRHVDDRTSGDRASACGAMMEPIGAFIRRTGEHVIVHRCLGCGFERFNRVAADDNFGLVRSLPSVEPRTAGASDGAPAP